MHQKVDQQKRDLFFLLTNHFEFESPTGVNFGLWSFLPIKVKAIARSEVLVCIPLHIGGQEIFKLLDTTVGHRLFNFESRNYGLCPLSN